MTMDRRSMKLAPSILAADFGHLAAQVDEVVAAGADRIHIDVMDGHFVPNISMGAPIVQSVRKLTTLPLEIHLMVSNPDFLLDGLVAAGADSFLVHWEGNNNLHRTLQRVRTLNKRVGVVINPATPASVLEEVLRLIDQVLVMTVDPGFGGQHFLNTTLTKIKRVRKMIDAVNPSCELELDGGIGPAMAPLVVAAGADVLVAGTSVFGDREGVAAGMNKLRGSMQPAA
jgi:ribulose-phosphate 3-epimerase